MKKSAVRVFKGFSFLISAQFNSLGFNGVDIEIEHITWINDSEFLSFLLCLSVITGVFLSLSSDLHGQLSGSEPENLPSSPISLPAIDNLYVPELNGVLI